MTPPPYPDPAPTSPEPAAVSCDRCGATSATVPLTWSTSVEQRGRARRTVRYCDRCSRENVRSIEGRLDEVWW